MPDLTVDRRRASPGPPAFAHGGPHPGRRRRGPALRLVHDHGAARPRGPRVLRQGRGRAVRADGATRPGRRLARRNTSGGGLSYTHPGQFGMFLLVEAVRQLRGDVPATARSPGPRSPWPTAAAACCRPPARSSSERRRRCEPEPRAGATPRRTGPSGRERRTREQARDPTSDEASRSGRPPATAPGAPLVHRLRATALVPPTICPQCGSPPWSGDRHPAGESSTPRAPSTRRPPRPGRPGAVLGRARRPGRRRPADVQRGRLRPRVEASGRAGHRLGAAGRRPEPRVFTPT